MTPPRTQPGDRGDAVRAWQAYLVAQGYRCAIDGVHGRATEAASLACEAASRPVAISPNGLAFIRAWEGVRLQVYRDTAGFPTIGVGHLIRPGEDFSGGITLEQADALLASDLAPVLRAIAAIGPLVQCQIDALAAFGFNVGIGWLAKGSVYRAAREGGDMREALGRFVKAGGRVEPGLVRRRAAEADVYERGVYRGP